MTQRIFSLIGLLFVFTCCHEGQAADKLSALIVDGQNNHAWKVTTPILRKILEHSGRFTVDVATSPPRKRSLEGFRPEFKKYDVVVSNYNGAEWPEETKKDFVDYVAGGGGFVTVHAANNAFSKWPEYNEIIGLGGWGQRDETSGPYIRFRDGKFVRDESPGRGGRHGQQHEFVLDMRAPDHPIIAGLPSRWKHAKDELYDSLRGPAKNLTVLATAFSSKESSGTEEHEPLLMTINYGKGRAFHTALGHGTSALSGVGFHVTLQRGAEWAATGKVTLTDIPQDFPTELTATRRALPAKADDDGWVALFNGENLDGWRQVNGTAFYAVEEGVIVGTTNERSPNSFLCTTNHYGDFELQLEVKVDSELNSGIQIRSNSFKGYKDFRVHGYQVEISTNGEAGFIYDEARRGWLSTDRTDAAARAAFKKDEWNRYRIVCQGDSLKTWINDVPVADVKDSMTAAGFIGLQVHSIPASTGPYQVRWRNIKLREL